jgi:hypothetical protein
MFHAAKSLSEPKLERIFNGPPKCDRLVRNPPFLAHLNIDSHVGEKFSDRSSALKRHI